MNWLILAAVCLILFLRRSYFLHDGKRLVHKILYLILKIKISLFGKQKPFVKSTVTKIESDFLHFTEPSLQHKALIWLFWIDIFDKNHWFVCKILDNVPSFRTIKETNFTYSLKTNKNMKYTEVLSNEVVTDKVVIYFIHGGGYISGSSIGYLGILSKLSKNCRLKIIAPDYELCPKVTQRHQVKQLKELYFKLQNEGKNIIIMGDSAGGGLTVGLLQKLTKEQMALASVLISPAADMSFSTDSYIKNLDSDPMIRKYATETVYNACIKTLGCNPEDPEVSYVKGEFKNFPECLIIASEEERMYSDSLTIVKKLRNNKTNGKVYFESAPYGLHVYPLFEEFAPEYRESFLRLCRFVRTKANIEKVYFSK